MLMLDGNAHVRLLSLSICNSTRRTRET